MLPRHPEVMVATISDEAIAAGRVQTLNDLWFSRMPTRSGDSSSEWHFQCVFDWVTPKRTPSLLLAKFLQAYPDGISIRITVDNLTMAFAPGETRFQWRDRKGSGFAASSKGS